MESSIPDTKRFALCAAAFILGGAVPIQLVTVSFGYAEYVHGVTNAPDVFRVAHEFAAVYIPWVYMPAIIGLAVIGLYCHRTYPDVARRIGVGFTAGLVATLSLDAIRQMGVIHGWLPGDTTVMFGRMATGSASFAVFWPAGLLVHYFDGAGFGLFYAFVWGKQPSAARAAMWAVAWALVLELGMMVGPPMAPMTGAFGIRFAWPGMFLLTFVAHVFFGVALGLLVQHFLRDVDRQTLIPFLTGRNVDHVG